MRQVCLVMDHLGHGPKAIHGGGRYALNVLPALIASGLDVTLCVLGDEHDSFVQLRSAGVRCVALRRRRGDPRALLNLAALVRQIRPGLLWATQKRSVLFSRLIASVFRIPWVVHLHNLNPVPRWMQRIMRGMRPPWVRAICVSRYVKDSMTNQYGVGPEGAVVLHNPVPSGETGASRQSQRADGRAELGIAPRVPVGLIIGRLHAVKGHDRLIRMLPALVRRVPEFVLIVLGEGPEMSRCIELTRQLGIEGHVKWLGFRNDVHRWLSAADLLMVTSQSEGLSYAAIEAAQAGVPVVAFDVEGLHESVASGESGISVHPFDESAFVDAAVRILTDATLHVSLSKGAVAHASHFGIESHIARLSEVLRGTPGEWLTSGPSTAQ
jgi:glycosyltransferase involved in cell wall biosynthesis